MFKLFLLILTFALSACQTPNLIPEEFSWQYRDFNESKYKRINIENVSSRLVKTIINDYKANPWEQEYTNIRLYRAFEDTNAGKKFLKFTFTYVNDLYVIYEVNAEGEVNNKFLLSQW
jgi:hypothetical protein